MSIEKLKTSLLSEAQAESERIINAAKSEAQKLIEEERSKNAAFLSSAREDAERILKEQSSERSAWARLEAKRIIAEAKEDAIKLTIEDFLAAVASLRKTPEYRQFMKRSVDAAIAEFGGGPVFLHVLAADKDLFSKTKNLSIVPDLDGIGGAILESEDGRLRVNLTLETLVETKKDELRGKIYQALFGGK
ncbi:hypothetical protein HY990_01125 [Candidatus Micrarchaeota archaeon]|nr:hypothetical protein [Candidatus Micrarchaeota archaeon]